MCKTFTYTNSRFKNPAFESPKIVFNYHPLTVLHLTATDDKGRKTLNSDTTLVINVKVPPSKFPLRVIQSGGNFLMQSSLNIIVPTFVRILSKDFERWSTGNNTRAEVEGAVLSTT